MVLIPLLSFLLYNNLYAIRVIHNQVANSNLNMLNLYMKQIDTNLDTVNTYLNGLISFDTNLHDIAISENNTVRVLSKVAILEKLQTNLLTVEGVDAYFVNVTRDEDLMYVYSQNTTSEERIRVNAHIGEILASPERIKNATTKAWFSAQIGDQYYLLRMMKTYDNYIGAWVNVKRLLVPMKFINLGENGAAMLLNQNRNVMATSVPIDTSNIDLRQDMSHYYLSGENNRYLVVGIQSAVGDLLLAAVIPDDKILENLPYLRQLIQIIIFIGIMLIPLTLFLMRRTILKPMDRLMNVMKDIRNGDIEVRLKDKPTSSEFKMLNQTFNHMLDEIHDLRISVYEEQINKQKAELEHLQNQVNPHFFLNSLNIIYRLAQTKRHELVQEMTMSLIQYFRYMFRKSSLVVPLRDELDHVRNYLRIQELRFPEMLTKEISAPEYLLDTPVPSLIVQTLVENVIKYAVTGDMPTTIQLYAELVSEENRAFLELRIRDNGGGFPSDVLSDLRDGKRIIREDGVHIGIWNLKKRLDLLYNGQARITFANLEPNGAEIDIRLPLKMLDEK